MGGAPTPKWAPKTALTTTATSEPQPNRLPGLPARCPPAEKPMAATSAANFSRKPTGSTELILGGTPSKMGGLGSGWCPTKKLSVSLEAVGQARQMQGDTLETREGFLCASRNPPIQKRPNGGEPDREDEESARAGCSPSVHCAASAFPMVLPPKLFLRSGSIKIADGLQALSILPENYPHPVLARVQRSLQGIPRKQRAWLQQFRQAWRARLGTGQLRS